MNPYLLYFLAGIVQDFLVTLQWRLVQKGLKLFSTISSALAMFVCMQVINEIVNHANGMEAIVCYSAGIGTGTFLAMMVTIEGG